MFSHPSTLVRRIVIASAVIGASACSDSTTSGARRALSLSLTTRSQAALADRALADITIVAGTGTLVITKAQVVARRIELAPADAATCTSTTEPGDDNAEDDCAEVQSGPVLLDLPLDASARTNITASVPPGTYRGLELRIGLVSSGNRRSVEFLTSHPDFKNASVRVEGTYNGKAFVFMSPVDARIETLFSAPVTVDASNPNVTVAIDLTNWFSDGTGGTLDPSNSANASRISANIASSFHAFEDDDHDGHDDRHR